jgi:hypothetical protein
MQADDSAIMKWVSISINAFVNRVLASATLSRLSISLIRVVGRREAPMRLPASRGAERDAPSSSKISFLLSVFAFKYSSSD